MAPDDLRACCVSYLKTLCEDVGGRSVGSEGNRAATRFFVDEISRFGWDTEVSELDVIDWEEGGATLRSGGMFYEVQVSPYSLGCEVEAEMVVVSSSNELEQKDLLGKVLLLRGEMAREPLMPKNFVFYNPQEHQRIVSLLEAKRPCAIVTATGRNASLAGGVYPFPMIEDGDFDIPSVYMTEQEGERLVTQEGSAVALKSISRRIPAKAYNIIATKGALSSERIVVTAHIDAKKGSPGAIDNATGVVVLLLLANLLQDYDGDRLIEIVPLNGEDYYAVPGQMHYLSRNHGRFDSILLNVNIDGAGYRKGGSSFSLYGLPDAMAQVAQEVVASFEGIAEGAPWAQGDHTMFIQQGRPAIAVASKWFEDNIDAQSVTHTQRDNAGIVDCRKVVEIAEALKCLLLAL